MSLAPERDKAGDAVRVRVLAIVGPTASGKTGISLSVAEAVGAEIVAADSMTIYRGMSIGTAKPSADDRARVRHHMIDVADPSTTYAVARFQQAGRAAIGDIAARRKVPLVVGGSGLYFRAIVDELRFPPTDAAVRAQLAGSDPDVLAERLAAADPASAEAIDAQNIRRVVRALEVMELTGRPFSEFRRSWDAYESIYDLTVAGLRVPNRELDARIHARTRRMIEDGLVDEVRRLLVAGFRSALTASRAIAYPEMVAHLEGEISLDEAIERIEVATRRYTRRQMTWFTRDPRIRWVDGTDPGKAAEMIVWLAGKAAGSAGLPDIH